MIREDVILDTDMNPIFRGSPEDVKATIKSGSPDYVDLWSVFEHRFVKIMTVTEYLNVVDMETDNMEFAPLPKRKWNQ